MIEALARTSVSSIVSCGFNVREVCRVLGLSSSGFYAQLQKPKRQRCCEEQLLTREMKQIFVKNYCCYGSARLVRGVRAVGLHCCWSALWQNNDNMATDLVLRAAQCAFSSVDSSIQNTMEVLHHSDRGSQYASEAFRTLLRHKGITQRRNYSEHESSWQLLR